MLVGSPGFTRSDSRTTRATHQGRRPRAPARGRPRPPGASRSASEGPASLAGPGRSQRDRGGLDGTVGGTGPTPAPGFGARARPALALGHSGPAPHRARRGCQERAKAAPDHPAPPARGEGRRDAPVSGRGGRAWPLCSRTSPVPEPGHAPAGPVLAGALQATALRPFSAMPPPARPTAGGPLVGLSVLQAAALRPFSTFSASRTRRT